ncbi:MAG TPA: DUF6519 domain-containing protein [Actinomycetota bacterium]|nr:DUF6519 domain-containing protein [Actinomycetota bacterium]
MNGDFTRSTFRKEKHYAGVREQQGRVQIDADWNEQMDILAHLGETEAADVIGPCGAPLDGGGFRLVTDPTELSADEQARLTSEGVVPLQPGDFLVTAGRYYVDGILCENDATVSYRSQPDLPDPGALGSGTFLVYLDVWRRHITTVEDPEIREVALGGPDTSTRTKTVWQVKALELPGDYSEGDCLGEVEGWNDLVAGSSGRLAAQATPEDPDDGECAIPAQAGYRRLENQLYRVEIHDPTEGGSPTFKWSRDNGSVVFPIVARNGNVVTVSNLGRDDRSALRKGDWVEVVDDDVVLGAAAEPLLQVDDIDPGTLEVTLSAAPAPGFGEDPDRHPLLRRWDRRETNGAASGTAAVTEGTWLDLEDGVQIRFEAGGTYRTGDYWLIPARTATGDLEWPRNGAGPAARGPHGVRHHYCRLAVVDSDGTAVTVREECRQEFPQITDLLSLFYAGGDGQEAPPGEAVPQELRAGVARGRWPVEGARVRFQVLESTGTLDGAGQTRIVPTGADGIAATGWTLDAGNDVQQVEATLVDAAGSALHIPIRFTATLAKPAREVPAEPAIHIERLMLSAFQEEEPLANGSFVPLERLAHGTILVACDEEIDKAAAVPPACFLTLDLLTPEGLEMGGEFWTSVYHPTVLAGDVFLADSNVIAWQPTEGCRSWMLEMLPGHLQNTTERGLLARFTLKGSFIWSPGERRIYLDGETRGLPRGVNEFNLDFPSGDGAPGGDFEMWFRLIPG